jgi:hypothetical protein
VVSPDRTRTYALDGTTSDTPLTWTACLSTSRRTRAEYKNGQIIITESIVTTRQADQSRAPSPGVTPDDEGEAGL